MGKAFSLICHHCYYLRNSWTSQEPHQSEKCFMPMLLSALATLLTVIRRHTKLETCEGRNLLNH